MEEGQHGGIRHCIPFVLAPRIIPPGPPQQPVGMCLRQSKRVFLSAAHPF